MSTPPVFSVSKGDKKSQNELIDELAQKIQDIKNERRKLQEEGQKKVKSRKKREAFKPILKPPLHHPSLEYVFGQVLYSPYLTSPMQAYSRKTLKGIDELNELKNKGYVNFKDIPDDLRPYDPKQAKKEFIKEIINYNASFLATDIQKKEKKPGLPSSPSFMARSQSDSNAAQIFLTSDNCVPTTSSLPSISMTSLNSSNDLYKTLSPPSSLLQTHKTKDVHGGFAVPDRPNSRKIENRSSRSGSKSGDSDVSAMYSLFSSTSSKDLMTGAAVSHNRNELGRNGRISKNNSNSSFRSEGKSIDNLYSDDFPSNGEENGAEERTIKESSSKYADDFEDSTISDANTKSGKSNSTNSVDKVSSGIYSKSENQMGGVVEYSEAYAQNDSVIVEEEC